MSTTSITAQTRMLLQDTGTPFAANVAVDGLKTVFNLPVESISSTMYPLQVTFDGVIISGQATEPYFFDYKHGVIAFYSAPTPAGATLGVQGWYYDYYTDEEVAQAVTTAFELHTADLEPEQFIDPVPGEVGLPQVQEYLVALLAVVECLWMRATDTSSQVDLHTPEGVSIPRSERFRMITQQIQAIQDEYKDMAGTLGVGLWRIQVLFQRRVSMTTNRLVPLFREQEYNQPYTGFYPTTGLPGTLVTIDGQWFDYTTDVTFGGVSCGGEFVVISDKQVQAIVPVGAQTGQIGVVTPYGEVLTTAQFVVGEPPPFVLYGPEQVKPPIPPGV